MYYLVVLCTPPRSNDVAHSGGDGLRSEGGITADRVRAKVVRHGEGTRHSEAPEQWAKFATQTR
jgi:hypothetical protein